MDWSTIEQEMIAAAEAVIQGEWDAVSARASVGIRALSLVAQEIIASTDMPPDEKQQLMAEYQQSLTNTITAAKSIAEAVAENAVAAAILVLVKAVPALAPFA